MHYWRKENFEGLKEVIEYLDDNKRLKSYRNYCVNREKGLRKKALIELDAFLKEAALWTFEERRDFVDWLLWVQNGKAGIHDLIPTPLHAHLVRPTLEQWKLIDPTNSASYRWSEDLEDLKKAVQLDGKDQIAHCRFARKVIQLTDYSIHELPGAYLGNPREDKELVEGALRSLELTIQTEEVKNMSSRLSEQRKIISDWINKNEAAE